MVDISKELFTTPATVLYWMKKYSLKRRPSNECAYVKQNPCGAPFKIKNSLTEKDKELFLAGLMLYWAEGSRRNKHVIQLANLDFRMLQLFARFLKEICNIREDKLCLTVQLYKSFNTDITKNYWSKKLGIPANFISVNIHSDKRSNPNSQWSEFGIARIEVRNVKLKQWIDSELDKYLIKWQQNNYLEKYLSVGDKYG